MSIAAVFLSAQTWKQPRCPSVGECVNYGSSIVNHYSAIKRNELSSHKKTWKDYFLKSSQSEKSL